MTCFFLAHSNPVDMPSRGHSEDGDSGIARSGMHTFIEQSEQM